MEGIRPEKPCFIAHALQARFIQKSPHLSDDKCGLFEHKNADSQQLP